MPDTLHRSGRAGYQQSKDVAEGADHPLRNVQELLRIAQTHAHFRSSVCSLFTKPCAMWTIYSMLGITAMPALFLRLLQQVHLFRSPPWSVCSISPERVLVIRYRSLAIDAMLHMNKLPILHALSEWNWSSFCTSILVLHDFELRSSASSSLYLYMILSSVNASSPLRSHSRARRSARYRFTLSCALTYSTYSSTSACFDVPCGGCNLARLR